MYGKRWQCFSPTLALQLDVDQLYCIVASSFCTLATNASVGISSWWMLHEKPFSLCASQIAPWRQFSPLAYSRTKGVPGVLFTWDLLYAGICSSQSQIFLILQQTKDDYEKLKASDFGCTVCSATSRKTLVLFERWGKSREWLLALWCWIRFIIAIILHENSCYHS